MRSIRCRISRPESYLPGGSPSGGLLEQHRGKVTDAGPDRVVTVVIPEFVVDKMRHQVLHGQTALLVKRHLLFERGVVVASVPYHLAS